MRVLITGGNGNIAKMIKNNLSFCYEIVNPNHQELDILDYMQLKNFYLVSQNFVNFLLYDYPYCIDTCYVFNIL